jgi:4-amino-4-deoxy-L-arabinose transferase-like glycosyltransferase
MLRDLNKAYPVFFWATVIVAITVFFFGLGSIDLMSLNEGRRALAIQEMVASGNWLLPHLNGELYLTKPPLLYWLSSAFAILGGINEWTLRLPSALAAIAVLVMVYRYTFKQAGSWAALFSVQILVANLGFAMLGRRAEIEMLLTALCVGSILSALQYIQHASNQNPASKNWIYLSYFLLALALMTKGPLVLLLVTLPLLVAAIYTKNPHVKTVLLCWRGWLIFIFVGLAWYAAVSWQLGLGIWGKVVQRDMLDKMQSDTAKPLLSYLGWIAVDFLLLIALFLVRPKEFFKQQMQQTHQLVLLAAVVLPFILYSLFSNKHAKYLLPIYPIIAILLAIKLGVIFDAAKGNTKKLIAIVGLLLPVGFAVFYSFVEPKVFAYRVAAFPAFGVWVSSVKDSDLYAYKDIDSRLVYYANRPIKVMEETMLAPEKNAQQSFLLLVESDNLSAVSAVADCKVQEFKPYLKKNKSLTVFGFGQACKNS